MVLLDVVPFTKGGYQNRTRVSSPQGEKWLTVPILSKGKQGQPTNKVEINNTVPWQKKIVSSLEQWYAGAPGVDTAAPLIASIAEDDWSRLTDLNVRLIEKTNRILGINTKMILASEMDVSGKRSELLAGICRELKADIYLSGPSGREYLDAQIFEDIDVVFHNFAHPEYNTLYSTFVRGLSVMDLIMNVGEDAKAVLL